MKYNPPAGWTGLTNIKPLLALPNGDVNEAGDSTPKHYGLYYLLENGDAVWLSDHETHQQASCASGSLSEYFKIYWVRAYIENVAVNFFLNIPEITTTTAGNWYWHQHIFWHYEDQSHLEDDFEGYKTHIQHQATAYQKLTEHEEFYLGSTRIKLDAHRMLDIKTAQAIRDLEQQKIVQVLTQRECQPL